MRPASLLSMGAALLLVPAFGQDPVTVSPRVAERSHTVAITVGSAPAGVRTAQVWLGEHRISPDPAVVGNTVYVAVPDSLGDNPFPLGVYTVRIVMDGRAFIAPQPLRVVSQLGSTLAVERVEPSFSYVKNGLASFTILGSGFAVRTPADNKLVLNSRERDVVWDGCPPGKQDRLIHGQVVSARQIEICNVAVPDSEDLLVGIRQGGDYAALQTPIRFTGWTHAWTIILSLLVVALAGGLVMFLLSFQRDHKVGAEKYGYFRALFIDQETDTYSLSKLQFYLWTGAALFGYAYFAISKLLIQRVENLPDVPGNLPGIVGIGAGTAIGAQLVGAVRGPKGAGDEKPSPSDLVTTGGVVAADRVQLLLWTTVGVLGYCAAVTQLDPRTMTTLPTVPDSLMYLMGLSSLGYLGGKFARKAGPVIDELSVTPSQPDSAVPAAAAPAGPKPDVAQPLAAANQQLAAVKAAAAGLTDAGAPVAAREARNAIAALEAGIAAAQPLTTGAETAAILAKLQQQAAIAHTAATAAAADFERLATVAEAGSARQWAAIAQQASAAIEQFGAGASQAVSLAAAEAKPVETPDGFRRIIEIRGRNLSRNATFRIAVAGLDQEFPFRKLEDKEGKNLPEIVVPEEDTGQPDMARMLRLTIRRDRLDPADRKTYDMWFAKPVGEMTFTLVNPDGQRAGVTFSLPPGASQSK